MSGETGNDDNDIAQETHNFMTAKKAKAKERAKNLEDVVLNIAITGESGAGKSSFVNALRGLNNGDEGAADTGVTETTLKAMKYSHPHMPNVFIWDLPGIGTSNFKASKYLKDVNFDTYDFFIIISSVRFKENDILLASEIKQKKKLFYFVRTKIDDDIRMETLKKDFDEDKVIEKIRQSCKKNLESLGDCNVFLISTFDLNKFDFERLVQHLEETLPEHKRHALIQSLPVGSEAMIEKKKKALYKAASSAAGKAGASAMVVIPGVSVVCGIKTMVSFLKKAHATLGLDDQSIKALSERLNKPEAQFRSAMQSRFAEGVDENVVKGMLKTVTMKATKTIEVILTCIPGLGTVSAVGLAYATTLHLLHESINEMVEDAKNVLKVVQEDVVLEETVL